MTEIQKRLFELQDTEYKAFHSRLMPTVSPDRIIGVRIPELRRLAKELCGTELGYEFLQALPHFYYEENNLHGFLIEKIMDFDLCISEIDRFLPYVDNWATCDSMSPKVLKNNKEALLSKIKEWIKSDRTYTIRFGVVMLMKYCLDSDFKPEYNELAVGIRSDEYYVKTAVAWYFATALSKQYEQTLPVIKEYRLEPWTHNKAIQKAVESNRISPEQKEYLRTFKIKKER